MPDSEGGAVRRAVGWGLATIVALATSGLFVGVALLTIDGGPRHYARVDLPALILKCKQNADCVLVDQIGCCSCETGGARWAVNRQHKDDLRRFLKRSCPKPAACLTIDACQHDLVAACVAHRCAAVAHG